MKKITSKSEKLSNRLLRYGALTAAAFGVADASGQIVYTDVDPDQVLNVGDDFIVDFTPAGAQVTIGNPAGLAGGNAAIVFPSAGGAFVGITAYGFQYPALMADGDMIDGAAGYTAAGVRGDLNYYGCAYSNSQWCGAVVDGYLGVRFTFSGNTHYGWVRLDTDVAGTNVITVKDFAYQATPGVGIEAGDDGALGIEDQTFNGFSYFADSNNLHLAASTAMQNVQLYNIAGQEIISQNLSSNNEIVNISSLNTGVYIATVTIENQSKSFKIVKR